MQEEIYNQVNETTRKTLELFQTFNEINVSAAEKLTALQLDLNKLNVEQVVAQAKTLTSSRDPQAVIAAESDLLTAYNEKLIEVGNQVAAVVKESGEKFVEQASAPFAFSAQTAPKAKKPARKAAAKKPAKKAA